jgi:hypothetical protein
MGWSAEFLPAQGSNRPSVRAVPDPKPGRPALQFFSVFFKPAVRSPARGPFYGHALEESRVAFQGVLI